MFVVFHDNIDRDALWFQFSVFRSRSTCNTTFVSNINIAQMVGIKKHARTVQQESKLCSTGIKVETSVPVNNQHTTTATMTLVTHYVTIFK